MTGAFANQIATAARLVALSATGALLQPFEAARSNLRDQPDQHIHEPLGHDGFGVDEKVGIARLQ